MLPIFKRVFKQIESGDMDVWNFRKEFLYLWNDRESKLLEDHAAELISRIHVSIFDDKGKRRSVELQEKERAEKIEACKSWARFEINLWLSWFWLPDYKQRAVGRPLPANFVDKVLSQSEQDFARFLERITSKPWKAECIEGCYPSKEDLEARGKADGRIDYPLAKDFCFVDGMLVRRKEVKESGRIVSALIKIVGEDGTEILSEDVRGTDTEVNKRLLQIDKFWQTLEVGCKTTVQVRTIG